MLNPLGQIRFGSLASSVSFRSLGLGFAWSWAWTLWASLSSLSGNVELGVASSPAWIAALASGIAALPLGNWALATHRLSLAPHWVILAAALAGGSSLALGLCTLVQLPHAYFVLCGVAAGIGTALLYLLWTVAFSRAPRMRSAIVIPLNAAITALPITIISGSTLLAAWAFTAVLPIISACMLFFFTKKDVVEEAAVSERSAINAKSAFIFLQAPTGALCSLAALVGVVSGSSALSGAIATEPFEGVFALISTFVALLIALATYNRSPGAPAPDYLHWALSLAAIGSLCYLQWIGALQLVGIALFRIAEVLAFIFTFTFALAQLPQGRAFSLTTVTALLTATQAGSLIGNLAGTWWGSAYEGAGGFMLVCLFASLCLVFELFAKESGVRHFRAINHVAPAASDDIDAVCDAIARTYSLAPRQRDVLVHLAQGRTVARIGQTLIMSENTVASYVKQIYARLGVHSKQELIDFVQCYRALD